MSYGSNLADVYRQVGVYTGRILKGAKPADFAGGAGEQVRAGHQRRDRQILGLTVPPTLRRAPTR
jgi:putative tryptophan/tyrosine transport system substrate-binding protein